MGSYLKPWFHFPGYKQDLMCESRREGRRRRERNISLYQERNIEKQALEKKDVSGSLVSLPQRPGKAAQLWRKQGET